MPLAHNAAEPKCIQQPCHCPPYKQVSSQSDALGLSLGDVKFEIPSGHWLS